MNILPKFRRCPCCGSLNLVRVNGMTYENVYHAYASWHLKKKFNCRICKEELALFIEPNSNKEKIEWLSYFECEDFYYDELNKLYEEKIKRSKSMNKKYQDTLKNIEAIQKKISVSRTKLKIKLKIKSKGMLIRHVY